jgi:polysaccharide pyruvyl transferase CsaB
MCWGCRLTRAGRSEAVATQRAAAVGITGSYGGLNRGDEAILTAIIAALRRSLPRVSLTVFSRDAEHTRAHHDVETVVPVRSLDRDEVSRYVEPLDLLLLGGGGILYDGEARVYLREVRLAHQLGRPTMAYAVGAGPLSYAEDERQIRETLPRMQAVTVRDAASKRALEHAGVECPVEVTADPALLLEPEPLGRDRLEREGVPDDRALVGMSLRERGPATPDLDAESYYTLLAHAADFVCDRYDADVLFIPMEQGDIRLAHAVIARMERADHAHVLTRNYRPAEILGLMEHLDMVIAMRLHVLIFAALSATPLFPLPYATKVKEFAEALRLPLPPQVSRDSVGALIAAIDRAWDLRHQQASALHLPVTALRERAQRTAEIALECIASRSGDAAIA